VLSLCSLTWIFAIIFFSLCLVYKKHFSLTTSWKRRVIKEILIVLVESSTWLTSSWSSYFLFFLIVSMPFQQTKWNWLFHGTSTNHLKTWEALEYLRSLWERNFLMTASLRILMIDCSLKIQSISVFCSLLVIGPSSPQCFQPLILVCFSNQEEDWGSEGVMRFCFRLSTFVK